LGATSTGKPGAAFGAGGAGDLRLGFGAAGSSGVVRIIWGSNRLYPSTRTQDL
jgi:hypothetical protein